MKAVGYNQAGPITVSDALIEFEAEAPEWGGYQCVLTEEFK
jgi:hypothetical protein